MNINSFKQTTLAVLPATGAAIAPNRKDIRPTNPSPNSGLSKEAIEVVVKSSRDPGGEKSDVNVNHINMLDIARQVGEKLRNAGVKIQFKVNENAGRVIIIVKDPSTDEVIREIPPEAYMRTVEVIRNLNRELMVQGIEVDVSY